MWSHVYAFVLAPLPQNPAVKNALYHLGFAWITNSKSVSHASQSGCSDCSNPQCDTQQLQRQIQSDRGGSELRQQRT